MTVLQDREAEELVQVPDGPALGADRPVIPARPRPRSIRARTADDWLSLVGAAASAVCLTWLLYTQVLPFAGKLGFVVVAFGAFLGIYGALTALTQPLPVVRDRVASALIQAAALVVLTALVVTVFYTFKRGFPALKHWNFYTHDMSGVGPQNPLSQGGIQHALVGSVIELGLAVAISLPLGLITAIYLVEIGGRFARVVRTIVEAMTALPDLVAGLFVYAFWILAFGFSQNGFAAALALSITMLPIIARSSDVVLRVVPGGLREASLALGASRWKTVWSVVLPTARSGLAGALILGMARGIGESAPLLIVLKESPFLEKNPFGGQPMNSLPLYAITKLRQPDGTSNTRGYGAACVLLLLVIVLFVLVRLIARPRSNRGSLVSRARAALRSSSVNQSGRPVAAALPQPVAVPPQIQHQPPAQS